MEAMEADCNSVTISYSYARQQPSMGACQPWLASLDRPNAVSYVAHQQTPGRHTSRASEYNREAGYTKSKQLSDPSSISPSVSYPRAVSNTLRLLDPVLDGSAPYQQDMPGHITYASRSVPEH